MVWIFLIVAAILVVVILCFNKSESNSKPIPSNKSKGNISSSSLSFQAKLMDAMHNLPDSEPGQYWKGFKVRKPLEAKAIEQLLNKNMSTYNNKDAFEIVTTLLRWSENAGVPIDQLKTWYISNLKVYANGISIDESIKVLKSEKMKEAKERHISPEHTICHFMIEFLLESEKQLDETVNALAYNSEMLETRENNLAEHEEKLNLAPDISELDREENKLFALANKAVGMFDGFVCEIGAEPKHLGVDGKVEALLLCSTMVIELHSNFKNEIDMDVEADRYFLLLFDKVMCDIPAEDTIDFLNKRIEFYNKQCEGYKNMKALEIFKTGNPLLRIYNAIYNYPLNARLEEITNSSLYTNDLVMFKTLFDKVLKFVKIERDRIVGKGYSIEEDIRMKALEIFEGIVPESRRAEMNQDMAWLISDQMIQMLLSGKIDEKIKQSLPHNAKNKIQDFISFCSSNDVSKESLADLLDVVQQDFI